MASAEEQLNEQGEKALIRRRVKVTIPKDRLTASINISPPTSDEPPVTEQEVFKSLQDAGVVYGIDNDKVVWSVAERRFGEPIEVAQGKPMVQGKHTEFEYFFQTENRFQPQEDEDGRIDYRDMGYIQNATKDMLMIRRTLPQEGTPGVGVDGQPIDAPRGRNIPFNHGENIRVSEDGLELYANCDGAIVFSRGRVAIKDVMQIKDVDFNVGNIDCVGSVRVTGNICSGFSVRVGGDLEVNGGIEDATVYCAGNILVRGGMFGGGEGSVTAEGDITVKYAQGSKISAGGDVVVGGELLNCQVTARGNVLVKGRKGKIAGGEINAAKEIQAHEIGSDAGTQTVLTVAFDENLMRAYHEATHEIDRINSDSERVKEKLYLLYKLQMDNKLSPEHAEVLKKLEEFEKSVPLELKNLEVKKAEIEQKLLQLRDAKIVAQGRIYPGVKAHVGHLVKEIDEELTKCSLAQDGQRIFMTKLDK